MKNSNPSLGTWRFQGRERYGVTCALLTIIVFGVILESRTALRRDPMTDLGVFSAAAEAIKTGRNPYHAVDWHGWHYQYPPPLAIAFYPLALPIAPAPTNTTAVSPVKVEMPWGYQYDGQSKFYGLHAENLRFFVIVLVWFVFSVALTLLATHLIACTLEQSGWQQPPPMELVARRRWWLLRGIPISVCLVSIGTDFSRGQVDVLMLGAIAAGLYQAGRRRDFIAGWMFSVPAVIKLYPPLILLFPFWRRRWSMAMGTLFGLLLALAIFPVMTLGFNRTTELYRTWVNVLVKPALGSGTDTSRANELTNMNACDNQSLLIFIHNWTYRSLKIEARPLQASPNARLAVNIVGLLLLVGWGWLAGIRRTDSPLQLTLLMGLLIGVGLVVSPTVHNFYYLLVLPLVAALVQLLWVNPKGLPPRWTFGVLGLFGLTDMLARMPSLGNWLRQMGLPLITLVLLLAAGAISLHRYSSSTVSRTRTTVDED